MWHKWRSAGLCDVGQVTWQCVVWHRWGSTMLCDRSDKVQHCMAQVKIQNLPMHSEVSFLYLYVQFRWFQVYCTTVFHCSILWNWINLLSKYPTRDRPLVFSGGGRALGHGVKDLLGSQAIHKHCWVSKSPIKYLPHKSIGLPFLLLRKSQTIKISLFLEFPTPEIFISHCYC